MRLPLRSLNLNYIQENFKLSISSVRSDIMSTQSELIDDVQQMREHFNQRILMLQGRVDEAVCREEAWRLAADVLDEIGGPQGLEALRKEASEYKAVVKDLRKQLQESESYRYVTSSTEFYHLKQGAELVWMFFIIG